MDQQKKENYGKKANRNGADGNIFKLFCTLEEPFGMSVVLGSVFIAE